MWKCFSFKKETFINILVYDTNDDGETYLRVPVRLVSASGFTSSVWCKGLYWYNFMQIS